MEFKKVKARPIKGKKIVKGKKYEFTYYVLPMMMYVRKHIIEGVGDEFIIERDNDRGVLLVYPAGKKVRLKIEVTRCPRRGIIERIHLVGDAEEGITFKMGKDCMKAALVFSGTLREAEAYAQVLRDIIEHAVDDLGRIEDSLLSLAKAVFGQKCEVSVKSDVIHVIKVVMENE